MQFPATLSLAGRKIPNPGTKQKFLQTEFIHFRPFSATLGSAGNYAPPSGQTGKIFRLDLFISGNFQQLWVQLAVKPPSRKTEIFYSGSIHFRQFPATLPLAGRKSPFHQPNRKFFRLELFISGNFQQLWVQLAKKTSPVAKYGIYFKLDLSISGNFQQICLQLVEKHPFQQPN